VFAAAIKSVERRKLLAFIVLTATLFALIACWDRKNLLAVQPGDATILQLLYDLFFALIVALFLYGVLARSPAPNEIPSIVPHPTDPPAADRNSATAPGV
jgi:small-conductance mechanosensitive channel